MRIIADLQIHSKHARATSKNLSIANLEKYARIKGIDLLGVGDFQHPLHRKEIDAELKEDDKGILWTSGKFPFIWQTEVSLMFSQIGKRRAVHLLVFAPNKGIADEITKYLGSKGRLDYDGRPIFGMSCRDFVNEVKEISDEIEIISAHAFTPWFGMYGSDSGFDSLQECFLDQSNKIYAIESGMSADPAMIWRLKENINIVSFSDAHCVHPDTLVALENGYVLPISEIEKESIVAHANLRNMQYQNGSKIQYTKVVSQPYLKEIKYNGGEIKVSDKHRFFIFENGRILEKYAFQLKEGDKLLRLATISHNNLGSIELKHPKMETYYSINEEGLNFIKKHREDNNFTQVQLANLLKLHKDHYWKIENGLIKINKQILKSLSVILKFDYFEFVHTYTIKMLPNVKFPYKSSVKLCELLGYFIGDGCYTKINKERCLILTDKNKEVLQYYQSIVKDLFFCDSRLFKYASQDSYGLLMPSFVAQFLILNFSDIILKSLQRRIQRELYNLPLEEIAGLLRGYFDAEGSVESHGVKACSANKLLLYQIDSLLKKFGICSSIYLNQLEKKKQKYRHNIILYGENLKLFYEKIGFNHSIKKLRLKSYIETLSRNRKSKIEKAGDFIISEIKSIKDIKSDTEYLYDLAVPNHENYIANQIIVHNSFWPWRLGREATIFEIKELSYREIMKAIRTGSGLIGTIETPPEYGKYHWDGHRNCNFSCPPSETKKLNGICPVCKKKLTIGVENRINSIAKEKEGYKSEGAKEFYKLLPLHELIAVYFGSSLTSKKTAAVYDHFISKFGNEFRILLDVSKDELLNAGVEKELSELIILSRNGRLEVKPGFDGEYGKVILHGGLVGDRSKRDSGKKDGEERQKDKGKKSFERQGKLF